MSSGFVDITWRGRQVRIEHAWVGPDGAAQATRDAAAQLPHGAVAQHDGAGAGVPLIVFLHEGLGSVAMWKDFPSQLCSATGCRGLVYSRPGYGRSTPRAPDELWQPDFLHRQAHEVLPALLQALSIDTAATPPWLLGHSDGGSIALLHAAAFPARTAGVVALAPHILVEDLSIASIEQAREAYLQTDLTAKLAQYHDDADSAFWGWNRIWLDPAFRCWSIEDEIAAIRCPLLAVQGLDDQYGTLAQIRGIAARVPQTQLLELPACGHSPQRDQPQRLIAACTAFLGAQPRRAQLPDDTRAAPSP